jgi:hypothetical protein
MTGVSSPDCPWKAALILCSCVGKGNAQDGLSADEPPGVERRQNLASGALRCFRLVGWAQALNILPADPAACEARSRTALGASDGFRSRHSIAFRLDCERAPGATLRAGTHSPSCALCLEQTDEYRADISVRLCFGRRCRLRGPAVQPSVLNSATTRIPPVARAASCRLISELSSQIDSLLRQPAIHPPQRWIPQGDDTHVLAPFPSA